MSRLENLIHRFTSQKRHLDRAIELIAETQGIVVEIGLGSGRTFDHLREKLPGRELFTFDYRVETHPGCQPTKEQAILGDISETLPPFSQSQVKKAALVHVDIGTKNREEDKVRYASLTDSFCQLLVPGGLLISDRELFTDELTALEKFDVDQQWAYYSYKKTDLT